MCITSIGRKILFFYAVLPFLIDFSFHLDLFCKNFRVAHFGELAPECINAYYRYGCALLCKAQDEADPLVSIPKKDSESQQDSNRDGSVKSAVSCESSVASISSTGEPGGSSNGKEKEEDDG